MDIINPFSVILLALILCILMLKTEKKRYISLLTLTILIEMLYLRGYFIVLGVSQMPYSWFMELVMFVYAIIIMLKRNYKVSGTLFVFTLLFLFLSCLSIYYFQFFPIDNEVIYNVSDWDLYINGYANKVKPEVVFSRVIFIMVPILSFFFNMMLAYVYVTKEDVAYIIRYICLTGKCYIGCIALECLAKNLFQVEVFLGIVKQYTFGICVNLWAFIAMTFPLVTSNIHIMSTMPCKSPTIVESPINFHLRSIFNPIKQNLYINVISMKIMKP